MPTAHHAHPLARALPLFLLAGFLLTALDTTAKVLIRDHSLFLIVWARYAGAMLRATDGRNARIVAARSCCCRSRC